MNNKMKIPLPDGREVEGEEVQIEESTERWNEYTLSDGSKIRIKMSVGIFVRIPEYDQEGNPVYIAKTSLASMVIQAPENLKKK